MPTWQEKFSKEIERAYQVRANNNEGQARVCARRAAGVALREYFARQDIQTASPSAYDLLKRLLEMDDLPVDVRQFAEHLTLRVNEEFKLPVDADLVKEAQALCERLLPDVG